MKKILHLMLCTCIMIGMMLSVSHDVLATEHTDGDYTYTVSDGVATITDFNAGYKGELVIPSELGGFPVRHIGDMAFEGCGHITSVHIPEGVQSIGKYGFSSCSGISEIYISGSVSSISVYELFALCDSLQSIVVDESNSTYCSIDGNLFSKDGRTLIRYAPGKRDAFYLIPDGVATIGENAFYGVQGIKEIVIPDTVTKIDKGAFERCTYLEKLVIPASVKEIGEFAFNWCEYLSEITIPDGVTRIEKSTFLSCYNLAKIVIPKSVTYIDEMAFHTSYHNKLHETTEDYTDICYAGTKEQWEKIIIEESKVPVKYTVVYNYGKAIDVLINGEAVSFDVDPQIINDRTMVPVRAIFEALGATVEWKPETGTVISKKGDVVVRLIINDAHMYINDEITELDSPAVIVDDRTMVPARAVSEAFGCSVEWNGEERQVLITK